MEIEETLFVGLLIALFVFGLSYAFEVPAELYGAALGASLTVLGAYWLNEKGTRERRQSELRALARQRNAARSVIAMDLSDLSDFCEQYTSVLLETYRQIRASDFMPPSDEAHAALVSRTRDNIPKVNKEILSRIQKLIELENDENGKHLAAFLHWIQVSNSRARGHFQEYYEPSTVSRTRVFTVNNALFPIQTIVQLHVRIAALFPYARSEVDQIDQSYVFSENGKFNESAIANSMANLELHDELEQKDYKSILSSLKEVDVFTGNK